MTELLEVKNLSVSFETDQGEVQAVRDVSFTLRPGETLAIVGESGCGKSALCKSIMKLLPASARIKSGSICVNGVEISGYREREMQKLRGKLFSMVLQDPLTALNPTMSVGAQIAEAVRVHQPKISREAMHDRVLELMRLVEIDRAQELMNLYPYSFSGGMRQRCVLAIALAGSPAILFADEPTTALDVTIQAQILKLLRDIQQELGMASVLVTHDLGVAAQAAERFGEVIINDISAGELDPAMPATAARLGVPYIIMHMKGDPQTMQTLTDYRSDIVTEVCGYFGRRVAELTAAGIRRGNIVLDPGFGFAKTLEQNYELLAGLHKLCALGFPVLAGMSRKSMIYRALDASPADALAGTVALGWEALRQGATVLRVHDVREAADTVRLFGLYEQNRKQA